MDKVEIHSTSRDSAVASDIVLRQGERVRLVFRPEIVNNADDPTACLRGRFLYQKKAKSAEWEDEERRSLGRLGMGEEYQLEIRSAELKKLLRDLAAIYRFARKQGVPTGHVELVKLERHLVEFVDLSDADLKRLLNAHPKEALTAAQKLLKWLTKHEDISGLMAIDVSDLPELDSIVRVAVLEEALRYWEDQRRSDDEDLWQRAFEQRAFLLGQLLGYPIVVIETRAYVGGKRITNRGGGVADFVAAASSTGNAVLVEIKTPQTKLLGAEYRAEIYPPSRDISGAIAQVLDYRRRFLKDPQILDDVPRVKEGTGDVRTVVIAGDSEQLDTPSKRRSFELFRERVQGCTVITYDELFERAEGILSLLQRELH